MTRKSLIRLTLLVPCLCLVFVSGARAQTPEPFVEGLRNPTRMVFTPKGNMLVAETGTGSNTGRISIVDSSGNRRTLVDGLPSAISSQGEPSGPSGLVLVGRTLYVTIGAGDGVIAGAIPGTELPNPSPTSPMLTSVIAITLSPKAEALTQGFTLTVEDNAALDRGDTIKLRRSKRDRISMRLVADFPDYTPNPRPDAPDNVRASNPFGIAAIGKTLYVSDASQNALVRVNAKTGATEIVATFDPVPNPLPFGPPFSEFVPDSVRVANGALLVTGLTGFPFAPGVSEVRSVDPATGAVTTLIDGLTSSIDVIPPTGTTGYFVLQFTTNLLAEEPVPGVLLRFDTPTAEPVVVSDTLVSPTGLLRDPASGDIFVSEQFTGRIVRIAQ